MFRLRATWLLTGYGASESVEIDIIPGSGRAQAAGVASSIRTELALTGTRV